LLSVGLAVALAVGTPRAALANGAFPDSEGILLPADRADQLLLATNFGLFTSDDAGKTWAWSCEQNGVSDLASLYQMGPAPLNRLFAVSAHGLIHSDDRSCTWHVATGAVDHVLVTDYFPDPTDPMRILAVGLPDTATQLDPAGIYRSLDGGATFTGPLYVGSIQGSIVSVESARSDPRIVYVAMYQTPGPHPRLVKSSDGGDTWADPLDVEPSIGPNLYRIIAIDPLDPRKIFLRVTEATLESLAISEDGGVTFRKAVTFDLKISAFARLPGGVILVAGVNSAGGGDMLPAGYRSTDGGQTFAPWRTGLMIRALAVRDGLLYAAANNFKDGFALGVSSDQGATFKPMMTYDQASSVKACVDQICRESCQMLATAKLFPAAICVSADAGGEAGPDAGHAPVPASSGCGCAVGSAAGRWTAAGAPLLGALFLCRRRRRNAARGRSASGRGGLYHAAPGSRTRRSAGAASDRQQR
jgi:MYXO-CTERM domain-containing protein